MSTRSLIMVRDQYNQVTIYRHYDGYPDSEHGVLAGLCDVFQYTGFNPERGSKCVGSGDFAAGVCRAWKQEGGNIYIEPNDTIDIGEEYVYIIQGNQVMVIETHLYYENPTILMVVPLDVMALREAAGCAKHEKGVIQYSRIIGPEPRPHYYFGA